MTRPIRFVEAYNSETRDWYVTDRLAPGGAPVPDGSIREAKEVARKLNAHEEMLAVLERLDTVTTWGDSHSKYYTFNEDDAVTIRAAIANVTGGNP